MDLIKILATQDIDMGFIPPLTEAEQSQKEKDEKENAEKLKVLLDINDEKVFFFLYFIRKKITFTQKISLERKIHKR